MCVKEKMIQARNIHLILISIIEHVHQKAVKLNLSDYGTREGDHTGRHEAMRTGQNKQHSDRSKIPTKYNASFQKGCLNKFA